MPKKGFSGGSFWHNFHVSKVLTEDDMPNHTVETWIIGIIPFLLRRNMLKSLVQILSFGILVFGKVTPFMYLCLMKGKKLMFWHIRHLREKAALCELSMNLTYKDIPFCGEIRYTD